MWFRLTSHFFMSYLDARDMRMVMRPLLERYIRYRFPN